MQNALAAPSACPALQQVKLSFYVDHSVPAALRAHHTGSLQAELLASPSHLPPPVATVRNWLANPAGTGGWGGGFTGPRALGWGMRHFQSSQLLLTAAPHPIFIVTGCLGCFRDTSVVLGTASQSCLEPGKALWVRDQGHQSSQALRATAHPGGRVCLP